MAAARCPVCEDIINIGVAVKLYQPVTCPTCLANLKVVAISPLELERNQREATAHYGKPGGGNGRPAKKASRAGKGGKKGPPGDLEVEGDEEDEELYDDYILEKRLRHKTDYDRRRSPEK